MTLPQSAEITDIESTTGARGCSSLESPTSSIFNIVRLVLRHLAAISLELRQDEGVDFSLVAT